ncbi:unnamed protein product [Symbiodinium necroappetens]|uniref:Macro domain-containing protein n=1 Tax=Symbiodinium necroappetens TaxID=1628268 RepID=A0A812UEM0_9DINO|nr:unnamed protein product [Symbiodinium necroappetens]
MPTLEAITRFSRGFARSTRGSRRSLQLGSLQLQLHMTDDIVESPPRGFCDVLINPANEALVGTRLPYFPMQVEPPPELQNSRWCGMEAGSGMFYAQQVVDGRVHAVGGSELKEACLQLGEVSPGIRCPTGQAVMTPALGGLRPFFSHIVHAVPPFYSSENWEKCLQSCWEASLELSWSVADNAVVASPLLGAGARGVPMLEASTVALTAIQNWAHRTCPRGIICIAVRDDEVAAVIEQTMVEAELHRTA